MNQEKPEIMTVEDVAEYLRIKTTTVYEWTRSAAINNVGRVIFPINNLTW